MYLDFKMDLGSKFSQPIPNAWNGFVYTLKGKGSFGKILLSRWIQIVRCVSLVGPSRSTLDSDAHHTLVLGEGDFLEVENTGDEKLHFVLIAGQPLNEPVVQHGT